VDALVQPVRQNRQYRMRLIGRLLALTLEAKLPQEQAILRIAITILTDPSRIDLIDIPTSKALNARWRVFGMLKNVVNLSILFLKETFRK
jgi:hypothetical protein